MRRGCTGEPSTEKYITWLAAGLDDRLAGGSGEHGFRAPGFHADGVASGGFRRNRVLEGVGAIAIGVAGGSGGALAYVTKSADIAAEVGIAVIGSGPVHGEAEIGQAGDGERIAVDIATVKATWGVWPARVFVMR